MRNSRFDWSSFWMGLVVVSRGESWSVGWGEVEVFEIAYVALLGRRIKGERNRRGLEDRAKEARGRGTSGEVEASSGARRGKSRGSKDSEAVVGIYGRVDANAGAREDDRGWSGDRRCREFEIRELELTGREVSVLSPSIQRERGSK